MNQNDQNFMKLERAVKGLLAAYKDIKRQKETLEQEIEVLNKKLGISQSDILAMKNENERMKMVSAMLGDENHKRLMKTRVNRLVKELDNCISQIKDTKK